MNPFDWNKLHMQLREPAKIGIIGTVGVPAKYGGFETLVHHLVLNLSKHVDFTVYASKSAYKAEERVTEWEGAKVKYLPLKANGYQSVFYDLLSMIHAVRNCNYLLVLGVSAGIFFPLFKWFTNKKIIVNIDGLEWRRPKWHWMAKAFLKVSEKIACKYADTIITDNRILKEYVKIQYNKDTSLIEYGADHTSPEPIKSAHRIQYDFIDKKYAFKVARIEPENNIHMVLEAFAKKPDMDLVLVGNWDANSYGKTLRNFYKQYSNLHLLDPIYNTKQLDVIRSNAHFYVHGHSAGGTNPSLVEAMYLGIPTLSFDVLFNRVTTNNQAIYFNDAQQLLEIISNIDRYPLRAVAKNLKEIADQQYTWKNISYRYAHAILENYHRPVDINDYVPLDLRNSSKQIALQTA
jgi:glycosyltransferase involved in cell wall biosynthesis